MSETTQNDKTSNPNEALNVTPTGEQPTSTNKETEISTANTQEAVQKHVELRQKAEREAEEARKVKEEAEKARQESENRYKEERSKRLSSTLASRIENSRLPQKVKEKFKSDPIKHFIANQNEDKEWSWEDIAATVDNVDNLNQFIGDMEGTYGVESSTTTTTTKPSENFVDKDTPTTPSDGQLTVEKIKKMSPYEIAKLPKDVLDKVKSAGVIPD